LKYVSIGLKKEIIISFCITSIFLAIGMLLLHYELIGYGVSFFVFLPFTLGFILGKNTFKNFSLIGLVLSLIIFFILLIVSNLEGMVCILMALPLIYGAIGIGVILKLIYARKKRYDHNKGSIKSSVAPLLIVIILGITEEKLTQDNQNIIEVNSEIILPYSNLEVYNAIKNVDTLDAEKPFLMKLDLPIPQKCLLEDESIGGLRTCYFEGGKIIERITQLKKGEILRMDVIDYQLTGRKWLGFNEAIYTFEELENEQCKMTRTTTYTSTLYPRFYWEPLEKIGIEQEHQYVFNNLIKDLNNSQQ
jgi:hypothetical protein